MACLVSVEKALRQPQQDIVGLKVEYATRHGPKPKPEPEGSKATAVDVDVLRCP